MKKKDEKLIKKLNIERGIKRIVWVISLIGALIILIGLLYGIDDLIKRKEISNKYNTDPRFHKLSVEAQKLVMEDAFEKYPLDGFKAVAGGAVWFLLCWGIFYLFRWIIKGFINE